MNFVSKLWRVAILGICATLVISVATGLLFLIDGYPGFGPGQLGWLEWFGLGFVSSLYIGGITGLFYGVPLYALYLRLDAFPFWVLALLAIAPGLVLLGNTFVEDGFGIYLLCGGAAFLLIVHTLAGKWPQLRAKEPPDNTLH
ncbi:MAG: hypothetical protein WBO58_06860 [Gammaproteobacteria bacterium]